MKHLSGRRTILGLIALAAVLLGLGLAAPALVIYPAAGKLTALIKLLTPAFDQPQEISIAGGIRALFLEGELLVAAILLLFSVLFPFAKLGALWDAAAELRPGSGDLEPGFRRALGLAAKFAKFSMLDVMVLALIVTVLKKLPGESRAEIGIGTIFFALSVLISICIPLLLKSALQNEIQGIRQQAGS